MISRLLRIAIDRRRAATGESDAAIARAAGLSRSALCRALAEGAEPRAQTVAPLLRALGLRVALVPLVGAGEGEVDATAPKEKA